MRLPWLVCLLIACGDTGGETAEPTGTSTGGPPTVTGTSTTVPTTSTGGPGIEIGNGVTDHAPLDPEDLVIMVHGPQSGWHVEVSGRVTGFGDTILVKSRMETMDGTVQTDSAENFYLLANYDEKTDTGVFVNQVAYIGSGCVDDQRVCSLAGQQIRLCATVSMVVDPTVSQDVCAPGIAQLDSVDIGMCDAVEDGSWYPGWPLCELTPECTALVDPNCGQTTGT